MSTDLYIKPKNIKVNTSKTDEDDENKKSSYERAKRQEQLSERRRKKLILGAATISAGGTAIKNQYNKGNLTGRELLYHVTDSDNVPKIMKSGLKASHATDPNNVTNSLGAGARIQQHFNLDKTPELIYLGRNGMFPLQNPNHRKRESLKFRLPTWKMKEVDNPEYAVAQNMFYLDPMQRELNLHLLSRKRSAVFDGDAPAKYIVGRRKVKYNYDPSGNAINSKMVGLTKKNKDYERANIGEIKEFIKNNPKRFARGAAITALGTAAAATGGYLTYKAIKEHMEEKKRQKEEEQKKQEKRNQRNVKQKKTASQIIDEMYKAASFETNVLKDTAMLMGLKAINSGAKAAGGMSGTAAAKAAISGGAKSLVKSVRSPGTSLAKGVALTAARSGLNAMQNNVSQPEQSNEEYGTGAY